MSIVSSVGDKHEYSLQIQRVDVTDDGQYTCSIQSERSPRPKLLNLIVKGACTLSSLLSVCVSARPCMCESFLHFSVAFNILFLSICFCLRYFKTLLVSPPTAGLLMNVLNVVVKGDIQRPEPNVCGPSVLNWDGADASPRSLIEQEG